MSVSNGQGTLLRKLLAWAYLKPVSVFSLQKLVTKLCKRQDEIFLFLYLFIY